MVDYLFIITPKCLLDLEDFDMRILLTILLILSITQAFADTDQSKDKKMNAHPTVKLETNYGDMIVELYSDKAPKTVKNFLDYVESGFYDKTIFHRVINDFMIQGGGFELKGEQMMQKKPNAPIENEAHNGLKNDFATLAMARTSDPHSATGQFFINEKDNAFLNYKDQSMQGWGYCVFGKVIEGTEIINKIAEVETGNSGGHQDVPVKPVILEKASVVK